MIYTRNRTLVAALLLITLMLFSFKSHASWTVIGETNQAIHYIDQSRIKKTSSGTDVWWLMNFKPHIANQIGYASIVGNSIIDCKKQMAMGTEQTNYTEPFGAGLGSQNSVTRTWTSIKPNTLNESLSKSICNR